MARATKTRFNSSGLAGLVVGHWGSLQEGAPAEGQSMLAHPDWPEIPVRPDINAPLHDWIVPCGIWN